MEDTLRHFLENIAEQVREEVSFLEAETAALRTQEAEKYRLSAEAKAEEIRRAGIARAENEAAQRIAACRADCRRKLFERRQELMEATMEKVLEQVKGYTALPEYPERLTVLTEKALAALGQPAAAEVWLRREDLSHGAYIKLRMKKTAITVREGDFSLGGVQVTCAEKGLRADMSFDTAMTDAEARLGELAGLELE